MKQLKVGILGFGTVGTGVVRIFQNNSELISTRLGGELVLHRIADRRPDREREVHVAPELLTTSCEEVVSHPEIDLVIELIGGYEPARSLVLEALKNGKHVVTANKALLALHGDELYNAARDAGVELLFEAAVGGGIPVISPIKESLCANRFSEVAGIMNGTCNYILTRMTQEGADYAEVLKDAQDKGYAEADPTFDVGGIDAAHKLAILIRLCFGTRIDFDDIYVEGISEVTALDIEFARQFGYTIKLLAIGKEDNGCVEARVHPTMLPNNEPLAKVDGVFNAVALEGDFLGPALLHGQGAGMDATASAVMGDVMSVARDVFSGSIRRVAPMSYPPETVVDLPVKKMTDLRCPFYLRFTTDDKPNVLAQIAHILGEHHISIASMNQPERHAENAVPIVILTHEASEDSVVEALMEIDKLDVVREKSRFIRIEGSLA